jgi:hypothetical protein
LVIGMGKQMRLRLLCAGVGLAVLPALNGLIFLIDRSSLWRAEWPLPLILLVFVLCPSTLLVAVQALGGQRFRVLVGARGSDKRNALRGDRSGILALDEKYKGICC